MVFPTQQPGHRGGLDFEGTSWRPWGERRGDLAPRTKLLASAQEGCAPGHTGQVCVHLEALLRSQAGWGEGLVALGGTCQSHHY